MLACLLQIIPYQDLAHPSEEHVISLLNQVAMVKLNGGLGTSMGCSGAKSLITVRNDLTFLDMHVQQIDVSYLSNFSSHLPTFSQCPSVHLLPMPICPPPPKVLLQTTRDATENASTISTASWLFTRESNYFIFWGMPSIIRDLS